MQTHPSNPTVLSPHHPKTTSQSKTAAAPTAPIATAYPITIKFSAPAVDVAAGLEVAATEAAEMELSRLLPAAKMIVVLGLTMLRVSGAEPEGVGMGVVC